MAYLDPATASKYTYLKGLESASIEIPPFRPHFIKLGMYFDAVVVELKKNSLLFRLALAIL